MRNTSCFLAVFRKQIEQKVSFQRAFDQKPRILKQRLSQNVTLFMKGTSCKVETLLKNLKGAKGQFSNRN